MPTAPGTVANDRTEAAATHEVFGTHVACLAVSSTNSMHGRGQGVAGAWEGAAAVCSLRDRVLPPTININTEDAECALDVVPNAAREAEARYALSNSFAFGGLNPVLVFLRPEQS